MRRHLPALCLGLAGLALASAWLLAAFADASYRRGCAGHGGRLSELGPLILATQSWGFAVAGYLRAGSGSRAQRAALVLALLASGTLPVALAWRERLRGPADLADFWRLSPPAELAARPIPH